jgi:hypothetical protein
LALLLQSLPFLSPSQRKRRRKKMKKSRMEPNQLLLPLSPQEQDPVELLVHPKHLNNKRSVNANHPVARAAGCGEEITFIFTYLQRH